MIYPEFLKEKKQLAVTAPSDGIVEELKIKRLESALKNFKDLGYNVIETKNVRCSKKGRSSSSKEQAKQLEQLFLNDDISVIFCASGGDFLLEMLPFLDFQKISSNPKWIQGYSDPTSLLFILTTNYDIATIYGDNFKTFGMLPWHSSLKNNLEILKGNIIKQESFDKFEEESYELKTGLEPYNMTQKAVWRTLDGKKNVAFKGRIIGGCIDVLAEIFGTKYDKTTQFIEKYKQDGIIWYFDNCELSSEQLIRTLWKFRENGWFQYTKGIIFGRSVAANHSYYNIKLEETLHHSLDELKVPIIMDADIGHIPPRMTIINGAVAKVTYSNNKGEIELKLI